MLGTLIAFTGAAVLIAMVPGPSTVIILRQAVSYGRPSGLAAVVGNEAGVMAWGLAAALGLTALLTASKVAYETMRFTGAAVLVFVGVRTLWRARRGAAGADPVESLESAEPAGAVEAAGSAPDRRRDGTGRGGLRRSFRLGLVTNLANPKAGVFAVSFLPQFVPAGANATGMLVLLSALWALIDMVWYFGLVWLAGGAAGVLGASGLRRRLEQLSGAVLVGLGARLAAESR